IASLLAGLSPAGMATSLAALVRPVREIVDEQRHRQAVLSYLRDPNNVKNIQESGMALAAAVLVSVREHIESCESFVIQEWWPDSRRVTDVDIEEPRSVRPQRIAISERSDRR